MAVRVLECTDDGAAAGGKVVVVEAVADAHCEGTTCGGVDFRKEAED